MRVVHQRVNADVFADLATLSTNMARVTAHLAARAQAAGLPAVHLRGAADGATVARDADGAVWRTLSFLDGTRSHHRFDTPAQAAAAAAAAARLVADLADLPPPPLAEVILGFHDVVGRIGRLEQAMVADAGGRLDRCRPEAEAVLAAAGLASDVARARADGRLPDRLVHNDAKADNILFDEGSGEVACLVDLDTVGPGTVLFDIGDLVRSGAPSGPEDGPPGELDVRADVVEAILDGYAEAGAAFLTPGELALFPRAGPLMALEAAARFLTDYLEGDVYFRVKDPEHNLRRARAQLRLVDLLS